MDAQTFGAFIAQCRKEKGMTQGELAARLYVTDKAVSRWERGVGFPDIRTLEPLSEALGISVLELMQSKKGNKNLEREEADRALQDAVHLAQGQRRKERRAMFTLLGITWAGVITLLFLDHLHWRIDTILFTGLGVALPLFCLVGAVVLTGYGLRQKRKKRRSGPAFALAASLLGIWLLFFAAFFLAGGLGLGPVPS